jgi:hypothetical protein
MNTRPTIDHSRQERLQRLQCHAISWRHNRLDYRPPAQRESVQALHKRQERAELVDRGTVILLALLTGIVLGLAI